MIFGGEKDLTKKETIHDGDIKVKGTSAGTSTIVFWLYIKPPHEDQSPFDNRLIFMRGEGTDPRVVFYINQELNTLKCSLKLNNGQVVDKVEDLEKLKLLKFNSSPLCNHYMTLSYEQLPV